MQRKICNQGRSKNVEGGGTIGDFAGHFYKQDFYWSLNFIHFHIIIDRYSKYKVSKQSNGLVSTVIKEKKNNDDIHLYAITMLNIIP